MEQLPRIASERLAQQHAKSEHPEADVLAAFIERSLRGPERERVLAHLACCAECRDVVALSMPDIEPELTNVQPQRRAWYEWSAFRFGGLAAALTVVVIAVVLFRPQAREAKEAATPAAPAANVAPGSSVTSSDASLPAPVNAPAPSSALHDDEKAGLSASAREQDKLARSLKKDVPLPPPPEQRGEKRLYLKGAVGGIQGDRDKLPDRQHDKDAADALAKLDSVQNKAGVFGGVAGATVPRAGATSVQDGKAQSQENQVAIPGSAAKQSQSSQQNQDFDQLGANAAIRKQAETSTASSPPRVPAQTETLTGVPSASTTATDVVPSKKAKPVPQAPVPARTYVRPDIAGAQAASTLRWTISAAGTVQKSTDGAHWQDVAIAGGETFRVLAVAGSNVWAGGSALYRSSDMGEHWERVNVGKNKHGLRGEIVRIEVPAGSTNEVTTSAPPVILTTSAGQMWVSTDDGRTWRSH